MYSNIRFPCILIQCILPYIKPEDQILKYLQIIKYKRVFTSQNSKTYLQLCLNQIFISSLLSPIDQTRFKFQSEFLNIRMKTDDVLKVVKQYMVKYALSYLLLQQNFFPELFCHKPLPRRLVADQLLSSGITSKLRVVNGTQFSWYQLPPLQDFIKDFLSFLMIQYEKQNQI